VPSIRIPASGRTLVAHLSAYGLALVLDLAGDDAFVSHDPDSLELEPIVHTPLAVDAVAQRIRTAALDCESIVEADLVPGKTGNDRRPVIWARATRLDRAQAALSCREALLDDAQDVASGIPISLVVGLGAPAAWIGDKPHRGASRLDGVMGNHTSDFVRGALRGSRRAAEAVTAERLVSSADATYDKTGWCPPGTQVPLSLQWLAGLGLGLLPVGLDGVATARTPATSATRPQFVTLPVFASAVSVPRLRAVLQSIELAPGPGGEEPAAAARLRALGVQELVRFAKVDESNPQSVRFHFARGEVIRL